jgi:hypothetical protein
MKPQTKKFICVRVCSSGTTDQHILYGQSVASMSRVMSHLTAQKRSHAKNVGGKNYEVPL